LRLETENASDSMRRIALELGGKSPTVILDDANLAQAIPLTLGAGFMNSEQACNAGTRILAPACAANRACKVRRRQLAHSGRAVRKSPQARGQVVGDAEMVEHL
jgi:acyl-CoA reductase-like NAD-dependent aldehyde dehydrogenase